MTVTHAFTETLTISVADHEPGMSPDGKALEGVLYDKAPRHRAGAAHGPVIAKAHWGRTGMGESASRGIVVSIKLPATQ
jgi:hypothetical protein